MEVLLNDGRRSQYSIPQCNDPVTLGNRHSDLRVIANSVFLIEDLINNGSSMNEVNIPLRSNYSPNLNDIIERLIEFLFKKIIKINLVKETQSRLQEIPDNFTDGYTCLFSGGLDSFSGILNSKMHYGQVKGAFTVHADQKYLCKLINQLQVKVLSKHGIDVRTINSEKNKDYTRVTRGLLYVFNSLLLENTNIIISEVGPTMHQPRFTLLDDITFTTHPKVITFSKKIAEEVLGQKIKIIEPNANLTKSEVAANSPEKSFIKTTCSCRTSRFCNSKYPNGDSCYGCVTRKLAMLVADIDDGTYRNDILISRVDGKERNKLQYNNILHLLQFSLQCLEDIDSLPWYTAEMIKDYRKEDLFNRYSMDNFAGIYVLTQKKKIVDPIIQKKYEESLKVISKEQLQNRIEEVRELKFKPDFSIEV